MRLMTQAEYARRRGVSRQAISHFVRDWQLPTYEGGRVDADKLDGLYCPRIDAGTGAAADAGRARGSVGPEGARLSPPAALWRGARWR